MCYFQAGQRPIYPETDEMWAPGLSLVLTPLSRRPCVSYFCNLCVSVGAAMGILHTYFCIAFLTESR